MALDTTTQRPSKTYQVLECVTRLWLSGWGLKLCKCCLGMVIAAWNKYSCFVFVLCWKSIECSCYDISVLFLIFVLNDHNHIFQFSSLVRW